jgi:TonB family protein
MGGARQGGDAGDEACLNVALVDRLLNVFRLRSLRLDADDEVRFHLEQRVQQNLRLGMTKADAEKDAYTRFGNVEHAKSGMLAARLISIQAAVFLIMLALTAAGAAGWLLMTRRSPPVYELTGRIAAPVPLEMARPEYTPLAKRAKVQGAVRVRCVLPPSGRCTDVVVVRSLDTRFGLDEVAVRAVRRWRFRPATLDGSPVSTRFDMEVTFALR